MSEPDLSHFVMTGDPGGIESKTETDMFVFFSILVDVLLGKIAGNHNQTRLNE